MAYVRHKSPLNPVIELTVAAVFSLLNVDPHGISKWVIYAAKASWSLHRGLHISTAATLRESCSSVCEGMTSLNPWNSMKLWISLEPPSYQPKATSGSGIARYSRRHLQRKAISWSGRRVSVKLTEWLHRGHTTMGTVAVPCSFERLVFIWQIWRYMSLVVLALVLA